MTEYIKSLQEKIARHQKAWEERANHVAKLDPECIGLSNKIAAYQEVLKDLSKKEGEGSDGPKDGNE